MLLGVLRAIADIVRRLVLGIFFSVVVALVLLFVICLCIKEDHLDHKVRGKIPAWLNPIAKRTSHP